MPDRSFCDIGARADLWATALARGPPHETADLTGALATLCHNLLGAFYIEGARENSHPQVSTLSHPSAPPARSQTSRPLRAASCLKEHSAELGHNPRGSPRLADLQLVRPSFTRRPRGGVTQVELRAELRQRLGQKCASRAQEAAFRAWAKVRVQWHVLLKAVCAVRSRAPLTSCTTVAQMAAWSAPGAM